MCKHSHNRSLRRIVEFFAMGGRRLFLPVPGGCVIATIVGFTCEGLVRIESDGGEQSEISPCKVPHVAIPGVA